MNERSTDFLSVQSRVDFEEAYFWKSPITKVIMHEDYSHNMLDLHNDIALLKTLNSVPSNSEFLGLIN